MKIHAFRLVENDDIKLSIIKYCKDHQIKAACIVSVVGCLKEVCIRVADGVSELRIKNNYEIISLVGTIANYQAHLHIGLSDIDAKTIGGHLKEGSIVNTTAEIVLMEIEEYSFYRELDLATNYHELVIKSI